MLQFIKYHFFRFATYTVIFTLFYCTNQKIHAKDRAIFHLTAEYTGAVGYGKIYKCRIVRVIAGNPQNKRMNLNILASNNKQDQFLSELKRNQIFEAAFKKKNENEPYKIMPISGFVDESGTSWEIIYLKKIQ